jgi:hypothetical protein
MTLNGKCRDLIILLILPAFLTAAHCKKQNSLPKELPPITQEGKNTFGCKIDGEIWVPHYPCGAYGNPCEELSCNIANLPPSPTPLAPMGMAASRKANNEVTGLSIDARQTIFVRLGDYKDSVSIQLRWGGTYSLGYSQAGDKFIITKIDTVKRILSGEFQFTLKASDGSGRTVRISEGRFDFTYPFCKCSN